MSACRMLFSQSKESIDAAISDVLSKPWLPLPLGLKAPALDGVMGELQRQGIPKIPPSCAWMASLRDMVFLSVKATKP